MKQTLSRKPASLYVEGALVAVFETTESEDIIVTGVTLAEIYVHENAEKFTDKQVEIFVKAKEYSFEEVKTVKMTEI